MKTLVIARREFLGTRNLWIAAPLLGLSALGLPLLRGLTGQPAEDLRVVTAVGMGFGLCAVLGLILGAGLFAGDLAQKRAGFFLSRPVGSASLYFGKLLGSLLLVLLAGALLLAPVLLLRPALPWPVWAVLPGLLLTALTGLLAGHAGAIILRARSPWLLLDLATIGGFTALVWVVQSSLMAAGAVPAFFWSGSTLFAGTLVVLLLAGLLQVARGRGDLRAGHRVLSLTLAAGLLPLGTGGGVFAWTMLHPKARNLRDAEALAIQPNGSWVLLRGQVWGYRKTETTLLVDAASGALLRGPVHGWFTADGSRFYWTGREAQERGDYEIQATEFEGGRARARGSGIYLQEGDVFIGHSPSGKEGVIYRSEGRPGVLKSTIDWMDLESGKRIGHTRGTSLGRAWFLDDDRVLASGFPGSTRYQLLEWQRGTPTPKVLWERERRPDEWPRRDLSPTKERMLLSAVGNPGSHACDLIETTSGKTLARFEPGPGEMQRDVSFLSGGDVLVVRSRKQYLDLILHDPNGQLKRQYDFPLPLVEGNQSLSIRVLGEVGADRIRVIWHHHWVNSVGGIEVDLITGAARPIPGGLTEAWRQFRRDKPLPGGRLHRSPDGALHLRQPDGSLKRLTAPD